MSRRADLLAAGKQVLVDHGWIQNDFGSDKTGYCAVGALRTAAYKSGRNDWWERYERAYSVLRTATGQALSVPIWNDDRERTEGEVLAAFDRAIEAVAT